MVQKKKEEEESKRNERTRRNRVMILGKENGRTRIVTWKMERIEVEENENTKLCDKLEREGSRKKRKQKVKENFEE